MSLLNAFKNIVGIVRDIPLVGDLLGPEQAPPGAEGDMGYINRTDPNRATGFLKKAGKGLSKTLAEADEGKRPTIEVSQGGSSGGRGRPIGFGQQQRQSQYLPGITNPYFKNLYQIYDMKKIMQRNLITSKADVTRGPSPDAPSGPNIRLSRGTRYLED